MSRAFPRVNFGAHIAYFIPMRSWMPATTSTTPAAAGGFGVRG